MASNMVVVDTITVPDARSSGLAPAQEQLHPQPGVASAPSTPPASLPSSVSWKSFRTFLSLSEKKTAHLGWLIALLSVVLTIVALSPTFKSQAMSEKALKLAEWTALKDYIEECREELAAGVESQACRRAIGVTLPPPPDVKPGVLGRLRRDLAYARLERNGTSREPQVVHRQVYARKVIQGSAFVVLVLMACTFLFLGFENNRSRIRRNVRAQRLVEKGEETTFTYTPPPSESETATTTIRHPPDSQSTSLRRRTVRSHPIYRHANLDEALHHCSLPEIRLRLQNGEDINQHWPYLIYKLAITPPTAETPNRLEVARLCLDFGADVNALKGWNGQSALMIAIHFGNVDVAKLLIANGAAVRYSSPDSNLTALHRCVRLAVTGVLKDALEIMNMLFDYGADPNQEDRLYETPLHQLLIEGWLKRRDKGVVLKKLTPVALCLIEHGARLPENIKERYIVGNPLWEIVCSAASKTKETRVNILEKERY